MPRTLGAQRVEVDPLRRTGSPVPDTPRKGVSSTVLDVSRGVSSLRSGRNYADEAARLHTEGATYGQIVATWTQRDKIGALTAARLPTASPSATSPTGGTNYGPTLSTR